MRSLHESSYQASQSFEVIPALRNRDHSFPRNHWIGKKSHSLWFCALLMIYKTRGGTVHLWITSRVEPSQQETYEVLGGICQAGNYPENVDTSLTADD